MPLVLEDICAADIGSVLVDSEDFSQIKSPDSYQEKGFFKIFFFSFLESYEFFLFEFFYDFFVSIFL